MKNHEIVTCLQTLKSPGIQNAKVPFTTHLAIRQNIRNLEGPFSDVAALEAKYLANMSPEFREFSAKRAELFSKYPPKELNLHMSEWKPELDILAEGYKDAIAEQQIKNDEWQALLDEEVNVPLVKLSPEKHPELFAATLSGAQWEALSPIVDAD